MASLHLLLDSQTLCHPTDVNVILPEEGLPAPRRTLWLLHGMYGCYADWLHQTSVERYATAANLAVVMPSADNSFYEDMEHGVRFYSYITEELPTRLRAMLPLSDKREENYIAGLSMGGYGAMKIALRHPERFAAVASFSGVVEIGTFAKNLSENPGSWESKLYGDIFGEKDPVGTEADVFALLRRHVAAGTTLPDLYTWCGRQDFLYDCNLRFRDLCSELRVPLSFHSAPGAHEWGFWDMAVREFIEKIR